nr:crossover junction endodeoxyribonuclease RuvC [Saprospiraceae bacterium]
MATKKERIIGIDPGTNVLGYALIEIENKKIKLINLGVVKMGHLESQAEKLNKIFDRVDKLIEVYSPDYMAVEAPFFGKNVQSMLKLGRAQGVALAAGFKNNLTVFEYSPKQIKLSVTGNGNSSKEQVAGMVAHLSGSKINEKFLDATDALAVAICHHLKLGDGNLGTKSRDKRFSSWKDFAKSKGKI